MHTGTKRHCVQVVALLLIGQPAWSTPQVLLVPSQFSTIQAALNASSNGDEIIVAPGDYFTVDGTIQGQSINFHGKAVTLRSQSGPAQTSIAWLGPVIGNSGAVVIFSQGEARAAVLDGFTIKSGGCCFFPGTPTAVFGGGIYILGASPTIRNCIIRNNEAARGGGVYCANGAAPLFVNCVIRDNSAGNEAQYYYCTSQLLPLGGGIYCESSELEMEQCEVRSNQMFESAQQACGTFMQALTPAGHGGGIFLSNSTLTMTGCAIVDNSAGNGVGGFFYSELIQAFVSIATTGGNGGGISSVQSAMTLSGCTITGNHSGQGGTGPAATARSCFGAAGRAGGNGGGLYIDQPSGLHHLLNCIVSGNTTGNGGNGGASQFCPGANGGDGGSGAAAFLNGASGALVLSSCTLQNNVCGHGGNGGTSPSSGGGSGGNGGSGAGMRATGPGSFALTNSVVSGNMTGAAGAAGALPGVAGVHGQGGGISFATGVQATVSHSNVCGNTTAQIAGRYVDGGGNCIAASCLDCDVIIVADLNFDGVVNTLDLGILLACWTLPPATTCAGTCCDADFNGDGVVNSIDLGILLSSWTL